MTSGFSCCLNMSIVNWVCDFSENGFTDKNLLIVPNVISLIWFFYYNLLSSSIFKSLEPSPQLILSFVQKFFSFATHHIIQIFLAHQVRTFQLTFWRSSGPSSSKWAETVGREGRRVGTAIGAVNAQVLNGTEKQKNFLNTHLGYYCCVFRPAFGCCAHPKAGWNLFFSHFSTFFVYFKAFSVISRL